MGVFATYCQLCGLPVQHDHYVESPGTSMLKIYRGGEPGGGHTWEEDEQPFVFGPEHEWLGAVVGVKAWGDGPAVVRGRVCDGELEGPDDPVFVADGAEDYIALHAVCWELSGKPETAEACTLRPTSWLWSQVELYHGQLFEFAALKDDGREWMIADPSGETPDAQRSRARIEALLAEGGGRLEDAPSPLTIPAILKRDRRWSGWRHYLAKETEPEPLLLEGEEAPAPADTGTPREPAKVVLMRRRADIVPGVDVSGYPEMVWLIKPYESAHNGLPAPEAMAVFETFELELKTAVEADQAAILVCVQMGAGKCQYTMYARDRAECEGRIGTLAGKDLPMPSEYDNETDPDWAVYFVEMAG